MTNPAFIAQAVIDYIEAHPEKHNQNNWIAKQDPETGCGTSMCIGGTVNWLLNGKHAEVYRSYEVAQDALGLNDGAAEVLFFEMDEERAMNKLRKIANGWHLDEEDFNVLEDKEDEELIFYDSQWEQYRKEVLDKA